MTAQQTAGQKNYMKVAKEFSVDVTKFKHFERNPLAH
jgi:hypothetical protein